MGTIVFLCLLSLHSWPTTPAHLYLYLSFLMSRMPGRSCYYYINRMCVRELKCKIFYVDLFEYSPLCSRAVLFFVHYLFFFSSIMSYVWALFEICITNCESLQLFLILCMWSLDQICTYLPSWPKYGLQSRRVILSIPVSLHSDIRFLYMKHILDVIYEKESSILSF